MSDKLSNVKDLGKSVTQIIQFSGSNKKTIDGVKTDTISQSEFTRFYTTDGRRFLINTKNVDWIEVVSEKNKISGNKYK